MLAHRVVTPSPDVGNTHWIAWAAWVAAEVDPLIRGLDNLLGRHQQAAENAGKPEATYPYPLSRLQAQLPGGLMRAEGHFLPPLGRRDAVRPTRGWLIGGLTDHLQCRRGDAWRPIRSSVYRSQLSI
jgi:hypothetical protein